MWGVCGECQVYVKGVQCESTIGKKFKTNFNLKNKCTMYSIRIMYSTIRMACIKNKA